ncbi:MAG: 3-deoxy-D-manno-octulosonic acid transferase [Kiritimatiellae bacterium]|nr:3-deoxy-D-manno-octulosonic acid transferase [Kiritimatiellia bacterium]
MKWLVYNLLFAAVYPLLLPGFLVRMLRRGGYAKRFADRFALYPPGLFGDGRELFESHKPYRPGPEGFVWIHAVSVGEVQVAGQLMREWRAAEPSVRFCFSTTSSTGWRMAECEVAPGDVLIYNPLDFPNFVKSALRTVRPRAIILTESEIWPNFIRTARRYGIPLFLINARVSDRSAPRYRMARWWFGDVFGCFSRIFAQSDLDKSRLVAAGAPDGVVSVTGSFKFDVARRNTDKETELRGWIGDGRILLGGSTWPGEDEAMLRAYKAALEKFPGLKLVIAPRHFEKADAVEANIKAAGFPCVRRSRGATAGRQADPRQPPVFLADTTGELMGLYGIADVVFVGKSLCARGAQNMIEPCLCGKPTVVGPHTENFRPVMSDLRAADAIAEVRDADELVSRVSELLDDDGGLGVRASAAVERRRGVVAACLASIREELK